MQQAVQAINFTNIARETVYMVNFIENEMIL